MVREKWRAYVVKQIKKSIKNFCLIFIDIILFIFIYPIGLVLRFLREQGISKFPHCRRVFMQVGVFPIMDHYYEPLIDSQKLLDPLDRDRALPGINWNVDEQLSILQSFHFNEEFRDVPRLKVNQDDFFIENGMFESGDAEYFYNLIRLKKPSKIFEIGSGFSTLMARKAIKKNQDENLDYQCKHVCVEPYEAPWLEKTGVTVIRQKVEKLGLEFFGELGKGDILFIDSSHIIRPQGDVLFEFLELLPLLKSGVIVHIHDIYSPKDYSKEVLIDDMRFWNEQYLLEAFLTCNRDWKIIGAINFLHHHYFEQLQNKCPFLIRNREPDSFYIEKIR